MKRPYFLGVESFFDSSYTCGGSAGAEIIGGSVISAEDFFSSTYSMVGAIVESGAKNMVTMLATVVAKIVVVISWGK
jgi:hypothetical protein